MRLSTYSAELEDKTAATPENHSSTGTAGHSPEAGESPGRALHEVQTRLQAAVDLLELGCYSWNPQTNALTWDDRVRELWGLSPDAEVSYDVWLDAIHPEDRHHVLQAAAQAIDPDRDGVYDIEYRVIGIRDHVVRWIATRGLTTFAGRKPIEFFGVVHDVTARKVANNQLVDMKNTLAETNARLEAELAEANTQRRRLFDLSQNLFATAGFDGFLKLVNPAWTRLLGHSETTLLTRPYWDLIHPEDLEVARAAVENQRRGRSICPFENRIKTANGGYRWLSWTADPDQDCFHLVGRDVTGERKAREDLAEANRELVEQTADLERWKAALRQSQRLEAIGQLTAGLAHDFNNILSIIKLNVNYLLSLIDVDKTHLDRSLKLMAGATDRGEIITKKLLAFAESLRFQRKRTDINRLLNNMESLFRTSLGDSITYRTHFAEDLEPAFVDEAQLELALVNLAINARDAMGQGGAMDIKTAFEDVRTEDRTGAPGEPEAGRYIVISLADTGAGLAPDALGRVFDSIKAGGKGSGPGLAQVFGFVTQSEGGIKIENRFGLGAVVSLYLPIEEKPTALGRNG